MEVHLIVGTLELAMVRPSCRKF